MLKFPQKTLDALTWIIDILNKNKIQYQITGGFAAKLYGSPRDLNDIDIDISEKYFPTILPYISQYITYGPARFTDNKWDLDLITLNHKGQEIDIGGIDTLRISNKERTKWISYPDFIFNTLDIEVEGMFLKVIHPKELIDYKKELDGEHQQLDIRATSEYLVEQSLI